jgi:hypothetical protein
MGDTTASLGIQVTTTGAKEAAQDLDKLNASAKNVAQSTRDLSAAQQQGVTASKAATTASQALGGVRALAKQNPPG